MSSSAPRPTPQPIAQQRQQWEAAVLTARFPAQIATLVMVALLTPGPNEVYSPRSWEPMQRYSAQVVQHAMLEGMRALLTDELRQARRLVWTPLADLCRLERNAPLAVHAARLAQLYWELARRSEAQAATEVYHALAALC